LPVCAHQDAAGLARRGLALLPKLPDTPDRAGQELTLLLALGVSLVATKGFAAPDVEQVYLRARVLCERAEDLPTLFPVLYGLWNVYLVRSDLLRCQDLAMQMIALAHSQPDPVYRLVAHNVWQQPLFHKGDFAAARRHQEQGWALYDKDRYRGLSAVYGEDPGVGCLVYGAATLWHLGYPDQARRMAHAARTLADELSNPFNVAQALYYGAFTHVCLREPERVADWAEALMELCREQGFALLLAGGMILHGWSLAHQGRAAAGIEQMRQGLADWQATGALSHRPYQLALLAEALGQEGQVEEGLIALAEAETLCSTRDECFHTAELHRLRGELLLQQGSPSAEAEACFRQALETARDQQAKSWELRAATSLGLLYWRHGRSDEIRPLLADTHGWFTEGFDTPDWQEAKALLESDVA
jgi:predicted ATPase